MLTVAAPEQTGWADDRQAVPPGRPAHRRAALQPAGRYLNTRRGVTVACSSHEQVPFDRDRDRERRALDREDRFRVLGPGEVDAQVGT